MSDWVKNYYAVVDSMDVEKFATLHTEDVHLRFGNAETVIGRDAVVRGIADFWGAIKGLRHNFVQTSGHPIARCCVAQSPSLAPCAWRASSRHAASLGLPVIYYS